MAAEVAMAPPSAMRIEGDEVIGTSRSMASSIKVRVPLSAASSRLGGLGAELSTALVGRALEVFVDVERACSRFDPASPLSIANADPHSWHQGSAILLDALSAARTAHRLTDHRFDPRVLDAMIALGYTNAIRFEEGKSVTVAETMPAPVPPSGRWRPRVLPRLGRFHLGGERVDLGGIGKGLAVRWSADRLRRHCQDFLIEAGGDCYCSGSSADG